MSTLGLRNAEVQIIFTYEDESAETFIWEWDENGDVSGSGLEIDDVNAGEEFFGVQTFSFLGPLRVTQRKECFASHSEDDMI